MIKMSQKDWMKDSKKAIIYLTREIDCRIAGAIAYQMIEKYYGMIFVNYVNNGFCNESPNDLWEYQYLLMIGVSPNDIGMRTIRSMVHDNNIVWIDNREQNIPMWTEYSMLPGDRNPQYTLTELSWRYYHDMEIQPATIKLLSKKWTVLEMAKML